MSDCRCGWDGFGEHPCHGQAYTCRKPAKQRFIANNAALAGMQMKVGATDTYACNECWEQFKKLQAEDWKPWQPSAHSTGICICGAEPSFRNESLGLLRCTACLAKEKEKK